MVTLLAPFMHARSVSGKLHSVGAEFACTLQAPTKPTADDDRGHEAHSAVDVGISASQ